MIKKNYTIDELQIPENLEKKYENILNKIEKGQATFFFEKEFLYETFRYKNNLLLKNHFEIFKDFYFLELHMKYRINLENEHRVPHYINSSDQEIINNHLSKLDLNDLEDFFNEWNNDVINNDNLSSDIMTNTNKLINELKSEAKFQIKNFIKEYEDVNLNYNLNSKYTMFVLYSKYIYLLCVKIKETFHEGKHYQSLIIANEEVRFTEMSLVHTLIRHYSPLSKISHKNIIKSNHIEDFQPEEIHFQLDNIFKKIEKSNILKNIDFFKHFHSNIKPENKDINFQYKRNIYRVWISLNLNVNESGRVPFKEVETFHPLDNEDDLRILHSNFKKIRINNDLYLYVESQNNMNRHFLLTQIHFSSAIQLIKSIIFQIINK